MRLPSIRAKIVATVGPASTSPHVLRALIDNGVDVARLNFAHGTYEDHARHISLIQQISHETGRTVGILQDLPGPKLRVGPMPPQGLELARHEEVSLTAGPLPHTGKSIVIRYPRLAEELKRGHLVFMADGSLRLQVTSVFKGTVVCRVLNGGTVRSGNGVNIPKTSLSLEAFTRTDRKHLLFGMARGVDFVGISFVGKASDIQRAKDFAQRHGKVPFLIAKIERRLALKNLKSIMEAADGIMVARGDLGVEVPFHEVPGIQQEIVHQARRMGKPVIVATQVLETMLQNPRPTRAEATDIANAILEGTDAIMLSGETALGKYPVEAVTALREVMGSTEKRYTRFSSDAFAVENPEKDVFVYEACRIAEGMGVRLIVIPVRSGLTAARVSHYRPPLPIVALVNDDYQKRKFSLYWGILPVRVTSSRVSTTMAPFVRRLLLKNKWVRRQQKVLLLEAGFVGQKNQEKSIRVFALSSHLKSEVGSSTLNHTL
jgi:pyruvate kinase